MPAVRLWLFRITVNPSQTRTIVLKRETAMPVQSRNMFSDIGLDVIKKICSQYWQGARNPKESKNHARLKHEECRDRPSGSACPIARSASPGYAPPFHR